MDGRELGHCRCYRSRSRFFLATNFKIISALKLIHFGMLVNELTTYELERIIKPVIQLQPMSRVCSEIGEVLGIPEANREKIQEQKKFRLRYKGFDLHFYNFRWLRGRGPTIHLNFTCPATKWQMRRIAWLGESHKLMDKVCGEVVQDLKSVCLEEIANIKLTSTDITAHFWTGNEEFRYRVRYPNSAFNHDWKQTCDASPLLIGDNYATATRNWCINLMFNPGGFVRKDGKTILRDNWLEYAYDISKSSDAAVARMPYFSGHSSTFEEWSEDMISDLGNEVIRSLPSIWQEIHRERNQHEGDKGISRQS